jgi:hypothetical protein
MGDNIEIGKDGTFNGPVNIHHGPVPTATAALPPSPIGFTGRDAELARLLPSLDPAGSASPIPVLIFAVTGMGGIGKTALALHAAHSTVAKGWFPGGTLFVDLRGYDDNPVTADQAVTALLDALGVRGRDLPQTATAQLDLYRTLLAHQRRHMLLILDNASSPTQFTPLLPGIGHHRVLITSRDRPDSLPIRLIDLEALTPEDAVTLIAHALHQADERDDRPAREPGALTDLASLCGHLPLALQIAAAMLRRRRHRDIASLVTDIRKAGDPTDALTSNGTDLYGRALALRPVFDVSYRRLPPQQARLLRLLALAPGAETATEAVAALADLSTDESLSSWKTSPEPTGSRRSPPPSQAPCVGGSMTWSGRTGPGWRTTRKPGKPGSGCWPTTTNGRTRPKSVWSGCRESRYRTYS